MLLTKEDLIVTEFRASIESSTLSAVYSIQDSIQDSIRRSIRLSIWDSIRTPNLSFIGLSVKPSIFRRLRNVTH